MPPTLDVLTLPDTCLCGQQISLPCKGATETRTYVIVCSSIVAINDSIQNAVVECSDPLAVVKKVSFSRDSVNITLAGGTRNYLSAVSLTLTLTSGDVRVPMLALTVEDQGVLQEGDINVVVGSTGRRGSIIFKATGNVPPPASWTPPEGYSFYPDDILFNVTYNQMFSGSLNTDGTYTWTLTADLSGVAKIAPGTSVSTPAYPDASMEDVVNAALNAPQTPKGQQVLVNNGVFLLATQEGELPPDVTLNGGVYIAGTTALPAGLSAHPVTGIILTDGTTYYPNTTNNVGVLCAAAE